MVEIGDILDYFLAPWKSGYDVPKTLAYGIVLIIAVYLIFILFKKLKVRIDKRLALAISPYVAFGSILRVMQDMNVTNYYWFVTPGIYFLIAFIVITTLMISLLIEKKKGIPYFKTQFTIGLLLLSAISVMIQPVNAEGVFYIALVLTPWIVFLAIFKKWSLTNKIVASIQMFDASTTFVSINFFGYSEQHILPAFLMNFLSPVSFVFVKVIAVIALLFLIDRVSDDIEVNNYVKLIIGILGAATSTRDFTRLLLLV